MQVSSLDTEKLWDVHMTITEGMEVYGGTIIAEVPETASIVHKSMVPPNLHGTIKSVVSDGKVQHYPDTCCPDFRRRYGISAETGTEMAYPYSPSHQQALPGF